MPAFGEEILAMHKADEAMRMRVLEGRAELDTEMDIRHTSRLKEILKQVGWPMLSVYGNDLCRAVWMLVQHATTLNGKFDFTFAGECLSHMRALPKNEVRQRDTAYLEDRLLAFAGHPQIYGTQAWSPDERTVCLYPIKDEAKVDLRRRNMELSTLEDYIKLLVHPAPTRVLVFGGTRWPSGANTNMHF